MKDAGLFYDIGMPFWNTSVPCQPTKWISQPFEVVKEHGEYFMTFSNRKVKFAPYYSKEEALILIRLRKADFDITEDRELVDKFFLYLEGQCRE